MIKKYKNIIILTIIFICISFIIKFNIGNMLIDFSREAYIPYQINYGDKLFKDIFTIYGFWGYFVNSIIYKISTNFNLLIIEAHIISYIVVILNYLIIKKYTTNKIALIFSIAFIYIDLFSNSTFSFVLPYSFSTIWAVFGIYLVFYSILYKKDILLYLTLGFISINRIELFVLTFTFIIAYKLYKKEFNFKKSLLTLIFPIFFILYILINKISINDLITNYNYINLMIKTKAINYIYRFSGGFFDFKFFIYNLEIFIKYFSLASISYFCYVKKYKFVSIFLLLFIIIFLNVNNIFNIGLFICIILTIINHKKNKNKDYILLAFSIILSSKSIFAINSLLYSNFGYILILFYIYRQLNFLINKKWVYLNFLIILIGLSINKLYFDTGEKFIS